VLTAGTADLAAARALPLGDAWHAASAHPLRLEFLYSTAAPQMSLRLLVSLPHYDGVSGLRVALHTHPRLKDGLGRVPPRPGRVGHGCAHCAAQHVSRFC
jgi:hypothetical protein